MNALKPVLLFFFLFSLLYGNSQEAALIEFKENEPYKNLLNHIWYVKDADFKLEFSDIKNNDTLEFKKLDIDNPSLGFTADRFWVKVMVNFPEDDQYFIELARPITNVVEMYAPNKNGNYQKSVNGDGIPYNERDFKHRKNIFYFSEYPVNQNFVIYFKLESDGEKVDLPLKVWQIKPLILNDNLEQLVNGIYYGIIAFVFIIYFFFYVALKERSFIYYVIYVLNVGLLQFSIDGLTFQYFFPDFPILANKTLLLSAGMSITFVSLYTRSFLKIPERISWVDNVFRFFIGVGILSIVSTSVGGVFYEKTFPVINGMSLLTILFILFTIFMMRKKGFKVDVFFTLAFTLLVCGVTIFILNNLSILPSSFLTHYAMKFGTGLEVIFLSLSMANKFRELQQEKEKAQQLAFEKLQEVNKMTEEANVKLEEQVEERTREIQDQAALIEEKNKDITGSIRYSKRIQQAIMYDPKNFTQYVNDGFIFFKPKDIVSGDFYWYQPITSHDRNADPVAPAEKNYVVYAAVDCTGHGVPGAFMSIIGHNILQLSAREEEVNSPAEALDYLNEKVTETLTHQNSEAQKTVEVKDGMDIALVAINKDTLEVQYAGANNPLWYITTNEEGKKELKEIKADKQPIGSAGVIDHQPFTNHALQLKKGDCLYIFSDGFPDQFGGPKGKKYKYGKFKKYLMGIHDKPMQDQRKLITEEFETWRGHHEQIDDVCVIGVRL